MKIIPKLYFIILTLCIIGLSSCNDNVIEDIDNTKVTNRSSSASRLSYGTAHHFPNVSVIKEDPVVVAAMGRAWDMMRSYVVPYSHRREVGFFIYYVESTDKFWIGDFVIGPEVSYTSGEPPTLNLGVAANNLQVCAFFHCHTPYYGGSMRMTGASEKDIEYAENNKLPGIVYDYVLPYLQGPLPYDEIPPFPYPFGPEQRPDIYY